MTARPHSRRISRAGHLVIVASPPGAMPASIVLLALIAMAWQFASPQTAASAEKRDRRYQRVHEIIDAGHPVAASMSRDNLLQHRRRIRSQPRFHAATLSIVQTEPSDAAAIRQTVLYQADEPDLEPPPETVEPGVESEKPAGGRPGEQRLPQQVEPRAIDQLTVDTRAIAGNFPQAVAPETFLGEGAGGPREWADFVYHWEAPSFAHRPLYFEEINVERFGHTYVGPLHPFVAAGHFFTTVPLLPYKIAARPAQELVYTLGHYRPGSYVPYQLHHPELSGAGGVIEAGAVTGLIFLIP